MADLKDPRLIYAKGWMFLFGGVLAAALLFVERPTPKVLVLLAICVWCFARFYYFAFYVIEHYVDADYKFAGLWSFIRYMLRRNSKQTEPDTTTKNTNHTKI